MGNTDVACGELEGVKYNIFSMKEEDYTMKLMSTYGALTPNIQQEEVVRRLKNKDGSFTKKALNIANPLGIIFSIVTQLMITTIYATARPLLREHGGLIDGKQESSLFCWQLQR